MFFGHSRVLLNPRKFSRDQQRFNINNTSHQTTITMAPHPSRGFPPPLNNPKDTNLSLVACSQILKEVGRITTIEDSDKFWSRYDAELKKGRERYEY